MLQFINHFAIKINIWLNRLCYEGLKFFCIQYIRSYQIVGQVRYVTFLLRIT